MKPVTVGAVPPGDDPVTVKLEPLVAVPEAVVTAILPLVAPTGTVAVICEALRTLNEAEAPLKVTPAAPVKPLQNPRSPRSGRTGARG